jgi:hypothetical protein
MDGESAFPAAQALIGFIQRRADVFGQKLTENEETGRVGVPRHVDLVRARQHMERGMLQGVIASCFEDIREVKYHVFIIA